jgi:hypothetical protein
MGMSGFVFCMLPQYRGQESQAIIFPSPKSKSKNVGGNNHQTHDQCLKWEYIDKICHI